MEVSGNRGTPSYHPFYSRIFHYKIYKSSSYWGITIYGNHHMSHAGDAFRAEAKELLDAMVAIEDKAAEA